MFRNYLTSALRSLKRYKLFTLLNILGLATGMACTILIFLWVHDELSYDKFNPQSSQIYRLTAKVSAIDAAVTPSAVAGNLKQQIPAIKNFSRLVPLQSVVTVENRKFNERRIFFADSNFLKVFNYPLLQGDSRSMLTTPDQVVITEATAKKYFGSETAIGKTLRFDDDINKHDYTVSGILKNIPHNSHLQFDMLLPISIYEKVVGFSWDNFDAYTYLQFDDHFNATPGSIASIEQKINQIHLDNDKTHTKSAFTLQPLTDIHLHSHYLLDVEGQGDSGHVTVFSLIAIFILLIACINFMNLSTALAGQRAKEVGLRKTVGALRFQLIIQFMTESFMVTFVSLLIGVGLAWLLLPLFNDLSSKAITINLLNLNIIESLIGIAILVGLVSGSYPAFVLSSFNPAKVLKGIKVSGGHKNYLRNGLVMLQFAISVVLMVSTLVVNVQLKFIRNRDIGFNKQNLLYLPMPLSGNLQNNYQALKATLNENSAIANYTVIEHLPTNLTTGTTSVEWSGKDPRQQTVFPHIGVDGNFAKTFGLHLLAGRFFNDDYKTDAANYVLNETALKVMGMTTASAIGQQITMNGNTGKIIGVVKDFNFKPVQQTIDPLILRHTNYGGFVVIKTSPANIQPVITRLKTVFQDVYPNFPFSYGFVDQDLSRLYVAEEQMGKLFDVFSVISIIISCLGLFGLATFATQRRIKEIGVRRVLGASAAGIVAMLAKDFIKLVGAAFVIAFPVGWWAMNKWLDSYVYRIQISWWMFAVAGLMAVIIALVTISYQSIKAALANPVNSLRTE